MRPSTNPSVIAAAVDNCTYSGERTAGVLIMIIRAIERDGDGVIFRE
jgi:hypothetical protein